ncbi:MAG TPA: citrate/2-methylcitrate synthase, partial [Chitinophagales bacterium]|nr:citrate/2-methylcitrate synthase [Chitinophagales bacterium]
MSETAHIKLGEQEIDLPVFTGSEGEQSIDINKLRDLTGYVTLDSGFKNTGATKSSITFLDGELGILRYRGYPIEQLAEKSNFMEVTYLLLYGELPTNEQYIEFTDRITRHT